MRRASQRDRSRDTIYEKMVAGMTMSALAWSRGLIACALLAISGSISFAQNPSDMMGLFGAVMQRAIAEGARAEWKKVRPAELPCIEDQLQRQGSSTATLAQNGIFPNDSRVAAIRASCNRAAAPPITPPQRL
jgi:hypothetical protein